MATTSFSGTASRYRVVFDGQSLNLIGGFPASVMANYPGVPMSNVSVGGSTWNDLLRRATQDVFPLFLKADYSILVMNAGISDLFDDADSGATLYADIGAYATAARAAGADYIVACTTTPTLTTMGAQTAVASGSNGVNVSSFAGAGVLSVLDTTNLNGAGTFASSDTLIVATNSSNYAIITYTGKTATTFTGCTTTSGSGTLGTGNILGKNNGAGTSKLIEGNALLIADASDYVDAVADFSHTATLTDANNTTYFSDGVHWTSTGGAIGAGIVKTILDLVIV